MLLVSINERFSSGHILGQIVGRDQSPDVAHPRDQVAVVRQEAVQRMRRLELGATLL